MEYLLIRNFQETLKREQHDGSKESETSKILIIPTYGILNFEFISII